MTGLVNNLSKILAAFALTTLVSGANADNQTPTTSPVSLDEDRLPYEISLEQVDVTGRLPTLQSFVLGQHDGLWVLIGGRTSGLHNFTNKPIKNFPPSAQNRKIWVIDPTTWETWSRPLRDSRLSENQVDELSTTAAQGVQVDDVLYVVGGYGFSRELRDFTTYPTLTAFDLPELIAWVRREDKAKDLQQIIRQTRHPALRITGGQLTVLEGRAVLAFGQNFQGGYGSPDHRQIYSGQVRSFEIADNGSSVAIRDVRRRPETPNLDDYRRRDYNLAPLLLEDGGKSVDAAVALSGVFTLTNGVWTVPVEIDHKGRPTMDDPAAPGTFKQGMNGYNTANLVLYDTTARANHVLLFGGISYEFYAPKRGFVEDSNIPFINQTTAIVRRANGHYRQYLLRSAEFPPVKDASGARLRFGAEAGVFLAPDTPVIGNGLVDLRAVLRDSPPRGRVIGWIFGGIAAEKPNFGSTAASNVVFAIRVRPN